MQQLAQNSGVDGFCYSVSPMAVRPNCLTKNSLNLLLTGNGRVTAHEGIALINAKVGSRSLFQIPDGGYAGLGTGSTVGTGSIVNLIARAIAFIGATSNLVINGVSRAVNASTALQILLYKSGSYSGSGTGPFTAGVEQMDAPTVAVTPNASDTNSGTTSIVTWFIRSATGGRGKKSSPSEVLVVDGVTVRATVSSGDLTVASNNGYDRIGVGVTQWGFGATGPHYREREIAISSLTTVDGVANSVELEWSSAQLTNAELAPIDDDPPPAAVFAAALEDVVAVIGAYGDVGSGVSATSPGTAVAVSLPVYIESFPPDNLLFLPGAPVGVLPHPSGGFAFVGGLNYMAALTYTGGSPALSLQVIWATTGIAAQSAMFLGEGGRLYCFSNGDRGLVRIGAEGEPETGWAADVSDYVAGWNPASVVGGRDNDFQLDVFCHERTVLCFNSQLERWCAPVDVGGALTSTEVFCAAVTVNGALYLSSRDTANTAAALKLWTLHGGTGTTWDAYFNWNRSQQIADDIYLVEIAVRVDNTTYPVTTKVYANGDDATPVFSHEFTPTAEGLQHLPTVKLNERAAKSYKVQVRGRSEGGGFRGRGRPHFGRARGGGVLMRQQGEDVAMGIRTARQAEEAGVGVQATAQSFRALSPTESNLTVGTRADRAVTTGSLEGDEFLETDTGWRYRWTGTAWAYSAGVYGASDATRTGLSISAVDNGAWFFVTDTDADMGLWQVSGGVWTKRFPNASIDLSTSYKVAGVKVVGAQEATVSDPAGGATVDAEARTAIAAIIDRLQAHGLIA